MSLALFLLFCLYRLDIKLTFFAQFLFIPYLLKNLFYNEFMDRRKHSTKPQAYLF